MTKDLQELIAFQPNHIAFPLHTDALTRLSDAELRDYLLERKDLILQTENDPLKLGYRPKIWDVLDEQIKDLRNKFPKGVIKLIVWGGNRSSKTRKASNYVLQDIIKYPGHRWWCCDSTESMARTNQMRLLWEQMPLAWKGLVRGNITDMRYSQSDGFPKNMFVTPKGSEVAFKFYSMDVSNLPGPELDGVWCFIGWTLVLTSNGNRRIDEVNEGDLVQTLSGLRKVVSNRSRLASIGRVRFSNGAELVGTYEHPVYTVDGWALLGKLKKGDRVCAIDAKPGWENGITHTVGDTFTIAGQEVEVVAIGKTCTARSGSTIMARFLGTVASITRTATSSITRSRIWSACREAITCDFITNLFPKSIGIGSLFTHYPADIVAAGYYGNSYNETLESVESVPRGFQTKDEKQSPENANSAEKGFGLDEVNFAASVVSTWEDVGENIVYNLTVEDVPEYFANGILVHNCDELIPLTWVQTLIYRLVNRNGILLITFTPELGWNETYQHFYEGAQTIEETDAPLLPTYGEGGQRIGYRRVPRVMQCSDPTARIVFFHTSDNPFGNYPALVQELKGKGEEEILIRAYGLCTKAHTAAFPMFSQRIHVITQGEFTRIQKEFPKTLNFHLVDPCDGRNWFMIWVAVPSPNKWIIYREWPSHGHREAYIEGIGMVGPWALSGAAADGVMGPGQKSFGFSLTVYRDEILRVEEGEDIFARYIDSRFATSRKTEIEHVTSLIEQMGEVGMDFLTMVPGKGRIISLDHNDGSVDLINSALYYDVETELGKYSPKLSRLNEPQLQILETCPNTIYALEHWTGKDGQKGACKDPVDVVRGLFLSSVNYMDGSMYTFQGGGVR